MKRLLPMTANAASVTVLCAAPAIGEELRPTSEILYKSTETILGQPYSYPTGTAEITGALVTLAPGAKTVLHTHQVPLFAYVLEGQLEVNYGPNGTKTYKAGDAFVEAFKTPHFGENLGDETVRLLVVAAGAEGLPVSTPVKD